MNLGTDQLVQQIHDTPTRIVLAITGGGSRAVSDLLEVPGASRTLLEAQIPYTAESIIAYLGARPDEFCSERTARALAMAAFLRGASSISPTTNWPAFPALPVWPPTGPGAVRIGRIWRCNPPCSRPPGRSNSSKTAAAERKRNGLSAVSS